MGTEDGKNPNTSPPPLLGGRIILGNEDERYNLIFRTPNEGNYSTYPCRMVNRHGGRANSVFVDGHCEAIKVSKVGFQYYPSSGGQPDPRWMWDRE